MERDLTERSGRLCIVKAKGGMGNRMLCAASGILWARAAARQCYVDWHDDAYSSDGENSLFHFFDPPSVLRDLSIRSESQVVPSIWKGRLGLSPSALFHQMDPAAHNSITAHRRYSVDASRIDQPEPIAVFWHYMDQIEKSKSLIRERVPGYDQLSYAAILSKALREELPLVPHLAAEVDQFVMKRFRSPVIGVHIRYSDRKAPIDRCRNALRRMRARYPNAQIFLATDNRKVERDFRENYDEVLVTEKWLPEAGKPAHQSTACTDAVKNGNEAIRDMYLLSRCDALVYARRSTFSFVSECIGGFGRDRVIDVDRWNPSIRAKRLLRRIVL